MPAEQRRAVGRWELQRILGTGGQGQVWYAANEHGNTAAVKLIRAELLTDGDARARFQQEWQVAQRVTSRRVAVPVDADLTADTPYIAWEYVAGPTLTEHLASHGPLTGTQLDAFARELAEAVRDLHGAGVVHRDLKPSNVILSSSGATVIDLGVALLVDQNPVTTAGKVIGTPGWLTPEQLSGQRPTEASDVFNWAAVVVQAATGGQGPFHADTFPQVMYRIAHDPPDVSAVPPPLSSWATAALHKDPGARPTAQQIAAGLRAGQHAPADATAPYAMPTPTVAATPPPAPTPLTARLHAGDQATSALHTAPPAKPRRNLTPIVAAATVLAIALAAGAWALTRSTDPAGNVATDTPTPTSSATATADVAAPAEDDGGEPTDEDVVRAVGTRFVRALMTWDARDGLADTRAELAALGTGEFLTEIDELFGGDLGQELTDVDAYSTGDIQDLFVQRIDGDTALLLAVAKQTVWTNLSDEPDVTVRSARIQMARAGDSWKVENVQLLADETT